MTTAPESLKAVRRLLLEHLDIHENSTAYPTDLDPAEVGIVGDPNHRGGYHCGADRVDLDDYSVRESPRDRNGLSDYACALDIGAWSMRIAGKTHNLRSMSTWLVAQCKAGAPDTRDIREIIYSPDGTTVRRWDRLGKRSTGDSSHRWHTHISYHRDAIKDGRDQALLMRRYLTSIGLIQAAQPKETIVPSIWDEVLTTAGGHQATAGRFLTDTADRTYQTLNVSVPIIRGDLQQNRLLLESILAAVTADGDRDAIIARIDQQAAELAAKLDQVDEQVLAGLATRPLDEVATALRTVLGGERATELGGMLITTLQQTDGTGRA